MSETLEQGSQTKPSVDELYLECKALPLDFSDTDHRDIILAIVEKCHSLMTGKDQVLVGDLGTDCVCCGKPDCRGRVMEIPVCFDCYRNGNFKTWADNHSRTTF